jgi:hypothetical protein
MFNHKHYVPVLKGKRAEFPALDSLKSKVNITPLFEAVPSGGPEEIPRRMSAIWPNESPYFIDFYFLDDPDDTAEPEPGTYPLLRCFAQVAEKGQTAIPITGLSRSQSYQNAARQVTSEQGNGLGVRLQPDDFEDADLLEGSLDAIKGLFELDSDAIDLFLDVGSVFGSSAATVAQMHRANIGLIPDLQSWRTLTVVSSAFPLSLAPLTRNQWNPASRNDWRGWRLVVTGPRRLDRLPAFGDYVIAHPQLPPEGRATILAQLRYAIADSWLIWKGENVFTSQRGFNQFLDLCEDLIERDEFRGANFSQGDAEIYEKATTGGSPGNAESWRRIGTNHHLETVLDQIANLP